MGSTASLLSFARSAIEAGAHARGIKKDVRVAKRTWEVRNETVLSDMKEDSMKAKDWIAYWGNTDNMDSWKSKNPGGGTPLVCLYLFGLYAGTNPINQTVACTPILFCWISFVVLSSVNGIGNFLEMWIQMMGFLLISAQFFYGRINKRTPRGMHPSKDVWVALIIETLLANTLTCIYLQVAGSTDLSISIPGFARLMYYGVSISPFLAWNVLNKKALDLQAAVLRTQNMSTGTSERDISLPEGGEEDTKEACKCIVEIVRSSRDLRVTGLLEEDLTTLATNLGQDAVEAKYINFYINGRKRSDTNIFDLMESFCNGYSCDLKNGGKHENTVQRWIDKWIENIRTKSTGGWKAFKLLQKDGIPKKKGRQNKNGRQKKKVLPKNTTKKNGSSQDCGQALGMILRNITSPEKRNWWLCGAIARACDEDHLKTLGEVNIRNHWYALILAALAVDQNPTAIALAMKTEKSSDASDVLEKMKTGCENVLKYLKDDKTVYENRGIIFTTAEAPPEAPPEAPSEAPSGSGKDTIPYVKYSAACAWKAEQSREPVILGKDAFNLMWKDLFEGNLRNETRRILSNSVEWSKKVVIHVDYRHVFDFLGLEATSSVRDAALRGWHMHTIWVSIAILVHFSFPDFIIDLAAFSICCTIMIGSVDQYSHIVFVGFHLWRSPIGKLCLFLPPDSSMSEADINQLGQNALWLASFVVNIGGSWAGCEFPTTLAKELLFFSLMLGSVAPGFWYLVLGRFMFSQNGHEDDDGVIKYEGRLRKEGYEHRKSPDDFRPLGKDVLTSNILNDL